MRGFSAFCKKELMELTRSYKALVLALVFVLFGFLSPGLAKIMPEIFKSVSTGNIVITVPAATHLDAYAQFFKNITQMGLIVLLLLFANMLASETTRHTLVMPLSKGLSRSAVILAKYLSSLICFTLCYWVSAAIDVFYTAILFGSAFVPSLFVSLFSLWLFGAFVLALLLFSSTLANGNYGGLLLCVGVIVLLMTINALPGFARFNPVYLATENIALLAGQTPVAAMLPSLCITLSLLFALVCGSIVLFRRKSL